MPILTIIYSIIFIFSLFFTGCKDSTTFSTNSGNDILSPNLSAVKQINDLNPMKWDGVSKLKPGILYTGKKDQLEKLAAIDETFRKTYELYKKGMEGGLKEKSSSSFPNLASYGYGLYSDAVCPGSWGTAVARSWAEGYSGQQEAAAYAEACEDWWYSYESDWDGPYISAFAPASCYGCCGAVASVSGYWNDAWFTNCCPH